MEFFLKRFTIPFLSAIFGGAVAVGAMKINPSFLKKNEKTEPPYEQNQEMLFDNIINNDFWGESDPFKDIRKFHQNFRKKIELIGGSAVNEIAQREDDDFVYYDIKIPNLNSTSFNTKVENGYITISGDIEKKNISEENENDFFSSQSFYKSSFSRSFPLPEYVDQHKMEMLSEKDKIILKFPKIKV